MSLLFNKILIIDDSKAVHAFVKDALESKGVVFDSAFNGEEGAKKASSNSYDLILLDWDMPVMNGPSALEEMMKNKITSQVWMMTSHGKMDEIMAMLKMGAKDYLVKPFTKDILIHKIAMPSEEVA
ncbi:MAG: response regulator [Bacteriovoracaceae bacterium]|nr:response regulator [Bacteriovoracaceae bacterium]